MVYQPKNNKLRVAINGFGRIGCALLRNYLLEPNNNVQIVALNDHGAIEQVREALEWDSVYGHFDLPVYKQGSRLIVGDSEIEILNQSEPAKLPWKKFDIDLVVEATGSFTTEKLAKQHLLAGARQVLLSTIHRAGKAEIIVRGAKEFNNARATLISHASCTTSAVAPVISILEKHFRIKMWTLFAVQSVTGTQNVVDKTRGKARRRRSALNNIIPITTEADIAIPKIFKAGADKYAGQGVRVPVTAVHLAIPNILINKNVSVLQINKLFKQAIEHPQWQNIVSVTQDPVVSQDLVKTSSSAIIDLGMTRVAGGQLIQLGIWYDNVWAFAKRLQEVINLIANHGS